MKSQIEYPQSIVCELGRAPQTAGNSLRLDLLKRLLAVPTCSGREHELVDFLANHVRDGGTALRGTCVTDEWNNVYIRKGDADYLPCIAAHIVTVHLPQPVIGIAAMLYGPLVPPVMKLDFTRLSPYDDYQLEFSPVATGTWTNLGAPFTPTAATNTQYAEGIGAAGFIRVRHVP
jgi:hypothetical protein